MNFAEWAVKAMDQRIRELSDRLYAFRRNVNRMLAAEDAYMEYALSLGSPRGIRIKTDTPGRSTGAKTEVSFEEQDARLQMLYRRMVQAEENVADVEHLLVGMDPDDVEFLEDMYWYRVPTRIMADERCVDQRSIYHRRDKILFEMVKKL